MRLLIGKSKIAIHLRFLHVIFGNKTFLKLMRNPKTFKIRTMHNSFNIRTMHFTFNIRTMHFTFNIRTMHFTLGKQLWRSLNGELNRTYF